jgi:hypothetical protein
VSPHFLAQLLELADHPLPLGFLAEKEAPVLGLPAVMREAQEVENLRSCPALAPTVLFGKPSELDQPRLVLMEMKTELGQPFRQGRRHHLRILPPLEHEQVVVSVAD